MLSAIVPAVYRGRLAPSPTGYLHLGHARTFWIAQRRAREHGGVLVLRNEDLDRDRCKTEFAVAMLEDLHWFGLRWQEGPDCGGPFGPYAQSERRALYVEAFQSLYAGGYVYPCRCSRRDVQRAAQAPHPGDEEFVYPGTCRPASGANYPVAGWESFVPVLQPQSRIGQPNRRISWRFRIPDNETIGFVDGAMGQQFFIAGKDFGDFVVWRHDDTPSYQLAVTVDDAAMRITEVVRGRDLLLSTARQILLYRALRLTMPVFFHCQLMTDEQGVRLAKRHDSLSLQTLRRRGVTPESLRALDQFKDVNPS